MQFFLKKNVKSFLIITFEFIQVLLFSLPRYATLNYIKKIYLRINGSEIGKRVIFYPGVWIAPGRNLVIGDDVDFALDVVITTGGGVKIGDRTLVGYRTQILSTNHQIPNNRGLIFGSGHVKKEVVIGSDVWIGANCLILPGVTIGDGAVVAGGSIVTKSVEPYNIVAGNPAKVLRIRD